MSNPSHYQNLGLSHDAKPEAIVAAHAALTEKCRAELSPNADASRYLTAIDTALAVLSDPLQRAAYDQQLLQGERPAAPQVKAATASNVTAAKSKSKTVSSIASEVASKTVEAPISLEVPQKKSFAVGLGIGLAAAAGLAWFGYSQFTTDTRSAPATEATIAPSNAQTAAQTASSMAAPAPMGSETATDDNNVSQLTELSYDAASIDQFVGVWQGQGDADKRQALDISLKSADSLVFRLKTKSGNSIGDIVGVAELENGLARFFNAEYGCRLLITRTGNKLNVNSSGCQAFYQKGAEFDGVYAKPENKQPVQTAPKTVAKANKPARNPDQAKQVAAPVQTPNAPSTAAVKLNRYIATVKDSEGKTQRIELVAANEEAARAILRDFRGNPKVVRIRKAWF